ncbi:MAG: hypothetical protein LBH85_09585 [Treponema sp.]|jgi:transposase-like protein|nr:hypothetical protein [Treponema sp.]
MRLTIEIKRPHCHSPNITRKGKKRDGKQNYRRAQRGRQFTGGHDLSCRGCLSRVAQTVKIMLAQGIGIRDIGSAPRISVAKVLKALESTKYQIKPRQTRYDRLETDEFRTYLGHRPKLFVKAKVGISLP